LSSLGGIDKGGWLQKEFLSSIWSEEVDSTTANSLKRKRNTDSTDKKFHILFPTQKTVSQSCKIGENFIFLSRHHYESKTFPKEMLCDVKV
jgi:CRISPR/Cas system CSM-associated protein Csm5 (group 7 of RAMP superfamily)